MNAPEALLPPHTYPNTFSTYSRTATRAIEKTIPIAIATIFTVGTTLLALSNPLKFVFSAFVVSGGLIFVANPLLMHSKSKIAQQVIIVSFVIAGSMLLGVQCAALAALIKTVILCIKVQAFSSITFHAMLMSGIAGSTLVPSLQAMTHGIRLFTNKHALKELPKITSQQTFREKIWTSIALIYPDLVDIVRSLFPAKVPASINELKYLEKEKITFADLAKEIEEINDANAIISFGFSNPISIVNERVQRIAKLYTLYTETREGGDKDQSIDFMNLILDINGSAFKDAIRKGLFKTILKDNFNSHIVRRTGNVSNIATVIPSFKKQESYFLNQLDIFATNASVAIKNDFQKTQNEITLWKKQLEMTIKEGRYVADLIKLIYDKPSSYVHNSNSKDYCDVMLNHIDTNIQELRIILNNLMNEYDSTNKPTIQHKLLALGRKINLSDSKEEEDDNPDASDYLGDAQCNFKQKDYEDIAEWMGVTLNELGNAFENTFALATKKDLIDKNILSVPIDIKSGSPEFKAQVKANLENYIKTHRPLVEKEHQASERLAKLMKRALVISTVGLYQLSVYGAAVKLIVTSPRLFAVGFGAGFIYHTSKRISTIFRRYATKFEGLISETDQGLDLFSRIQLLSPLSEYTHSETRRHASLTFVDRMRSISVRLLITEITCFCLTVPIRTENDLIARVGASVSLIGVGADLSRRVVNAIPFLPK